LRTNPVQPSVTPNAMTVAQIDQALRDFVLQDTAHLRRDSETASQGASRRSAPPTISELVWQMAGASLNELDEMIVNLSQLRDLLHAEGERLKREIFGYLQLNQVAIESTKLVVDNIAQYRPAAASSTPRRGKRDSESERSDTTAAPSPAPSC
jgi:hypothetical protein